MPSGSVCALLRPSWLIAETFTPSTGVPPRVTRPVISTPASSLTSTGLALAFTSWPRSDFAAKPSRLKETSYFPSFSFIENPPSLPVRVSWSSMLLLRPAATIIRRTIPCIPLSSDSLASMATPESGLPPASVTLPEKATPRGMMMFTPGFFSPAASFSAEVCAVGNPRFVASITISAPGSTARRT